MSALAYLLLPVTGCIAYFSGSTPRVRFHGLQAVIYGAAWPAGLYAASLLSPSATRIVFIAGMLVWLGLMVGTAIGRDPVFPGLGRILRAVAAESSRAATPGGG